MNQLFQETQNNSLKGQIENFMKNPMDILMKNNLNVPNQYLNNPKEAVDYLLKSGQINQSKLNNAIKKANSLGIRI